LPGIIGQRRDVERQIRRWQRALPLLGPFKELQTGAGQQIAKTRFFKLARIGKAIQIEMPDVQLTMRCGNGIGLNDSIARAFHAALHTQSAQQMAYEGRLASAQIAMQLNQGMAQGRARRQALGKALRGRLIGPVKQVRGRGFYNQGMHANSELIDPQEFLHKLRAWGLSLGLSQIGVASPDLSNAEPALQAWLDAGFHGQMNYMASHGMKRARPAELVPGTVSVITARLDYLPESTAVGATDSKTWQAMEFSRLERPAEAIVSVYARGRDYHKVLRSRLQKLADLIAQEIGPFGHRVFTDSAPVLEAELAARSGIGWRGKHTLILSREAGSMFFLGEVFVDFALPATQSSSAHCGSCTSCIDVCPTQAIIAPYKLDARRCISYLTIEHSGPIPMELRPLIGNRIYGCDDCQLICPWNKFAQRSALPDFDERIGLTGQQLVTLFDWSEAEFLRHTEGSAIRRIGYERWQRNIAVAMGNALRFPQLASEDRAAIEEILGKKRPSVSALVTEHIDWALAVGG
jgi:epoxyqueuosine reductase